MADPSRIVSRLTKVDFSKIPDPEEGTDKDFQEFGARENLRVVRLLHDSDRATPSALIEDPPDLILAKIDSHGRMVTAELLQNTGDFLAYLMECQGGLSIVYVFKRRCEFQSRIIELTYGSKWRNMDWRIVPITDRFTRADDSIRWRSDWSLYVFYYYYRFDYLPGRVNEE
jgi:hypothetical protein